MDSFLHRCDGDFDDRVQPAYGLWEFPDDIAFSDCLADALTMQASSGTFELTRMTPSNNGSLISNDAASYIPRGGGALEQI
jgi:hypothetical protein